MGNRPSTIAGEKQRPPTPPPKKARSETLTIGHPFRTVRSCSSEDRPNQRESFSMDVQHRSRAADTDKASFLDLPSEIRNNVYSRVLIYDGYVRLMFEKPTKVPGLVLLSVCKQVHDEAASLFFAANSFYVSMVVFGRVEPGRKVRANIDAVYTSPSCRETRLSTGGLFFPAPRYHAYMTRFTIDATVRLAVEFPSPAGRPAASSIARHEEIGRAGMELENVFVSMYEKVKKLWEVRGRRWEGKMVWCRDNDGAPINGKFTMSFAVDEREELATKAVLCNWEF
ncbi:hypothetical protein BCR34DRAFT_556634 [Clohesyomyces aquaticus]|uniref:F-box domain-containing protein n=1 Tax=Clohesyomyces aquaticus TaxID=1231657 RepID=A0A1Y2A2P5_9PLEO|nr:hypothetical protein BCR34DRAFT_556634 [Clohesyomyces aquaticus]